MYLHAYRRLVNTHNQSAISRLLQQSTGVEASIANAYPTQIICINKVNIE